MQDLRSKSYFVESAEEYVLIPDLIAEPPLLDDARRFMRQKGKECLDEADRLDALYAAVIAQSHADGPEPPGLPRPGMDPQSGALRIAPQPQGGEA